MDLKGKCVLLGVSGGIAAYKMANVASALRKLGADVEVKGGYVHASSGGRRLTGAQVSVSKRPASLSSIVCAIHAP